MLPLHAGKIFAKFLDVRGDRRGDIVIGAPLVDNTMGKVYLFYSEMMPLPFSGVDTSTSLASLTLSGDSRGDQFGYSVAVAGDINGDGFADIIAGAPDADDGAMDNGKVSIYFGGLPSVMNDVPDIVIRGSENNYHLGFSVSPAEDVNGVRPV